MKILPPPEQPFRLEFEEGNFSPDSHALLLTKSELIELRSAIDEIIGPPTPVPSSLSLWTAPAPSSSLVCSLCGEGGWDTPEALWIHEDKEHISEEEVSWTEKIPGAPASPVP